MKRLLPLLALFCVFVSCTKTETPQGGEPHVPYQPTYEVGDYFKNDTLEGVVFYTYGTHNGLMVSLEEALLPWCDSSHVVSETGATNPYDGWYNTNMVTANNMLTTPVITHKYCTLFVTFEQETQSEVRGMEKPVSDVRVLGMNGGIRVQNAKAGDTVQVYNVDGRLLRSQKLSATQADIILDSKSLYIVKVGGKVVKVRL